MKRKLIIVETLMEQEAVSMCAGEGCVVVALNEASRGCSWTNQGLKWSAPNDGWINLLKSIQVEIDTVIIATRSSDESELQGMFALEDVASVLRPLNHPGPLLVFKRMRFDSLEDGAICEALSNADDSFDEPAIERAMLMAYANAQDLAYYLGFDLPRCDYRPPEVRLAVHWLNEQDQALLDSEGDLLQEVWCDIETKEGAQLLAFVPVTSSTLSMPMRMDADTARWNADLLLGNVGLKPFAQSDVGQEASAYPCNTTARFLETVVDQLEVSVLEAREGLHKLHAIGAVMNGDAPFVYPEPQGK